MALKQVKVQKTPKRNNTNTLPVVLNMDVGDNSEKEHAAMLETLASGFQPIDTIKRVNVFKKLGLSEENIITLLEQYKHNIGKFLEDKGMIPTNTGIMYNKFQYGATLKDAVLAFGKSFNLEKDVIKEILKNASKNGIYGMLKYIQESVPTESKLTINVKTTTALKVGQYTSIGAITFTGDVLEDDPVTVKVTPTNCKFKGLKSGASTEHSSAYTLSNQTTLEAINSEFAALQVNATATTGVKLAIQIDDEQAKDFVFSNVTEDSNVSVTLDTSTQLTQNSYVAINPLTFTGKVVQSDPVTVKVTPTNCTFKGLASSAETEQSAEYSFASQKTLEAINSEFAALQVKATATTGVKLSVTIDEGEPIDFEFTNVSPAAA